MERTKCCFIISHVPGTFYRACSHHGIQRITVTHVFWTFFPKKKAVFATLEK